MVLKQKKRKLALQLDSDYDMAAFQTPSMKKVEEDRNKVIPNYVMEAVRNAFQRKLSNFFELNRLKDSSQLQKPEDGNGVSAGMQMPQAQDGIADAVQGEQQAEHAQQAEQAEETSSAESNDSQKLLGEAEHSPTIEELIGTAAVKISRDVKANCIVTVEKGSSDTSDFNFIDVKVAIFKQIKKDAYQRTSYNTKMKKQGSGSLLPIKELLMEAVNRKNIGKGDKVIFIGGESIGTWMKGFFFIFDVDNVFFNISTHHLTENISADVIEAIINVAQEIGTEGREGHSIGTAFIVGKRDVLLAHSKPLLKVNPLGSLPEEARKITDPEMKETVKNLAQLDGVFLIDELGTILTAAAYLNVDQNGIDLPGLQGFGTRHRCTAAITKLTGAIGVVVSASGGTVRVFKEGKAVLKLP